MSSKHAVSAEALERFNNPRNFGPLDEWDGHARITGPCGDTMEVWLKIENARIARAGFVTDGCGPSCAAGSMATELVTGKLVKDVLRIKQKDILHGLGGLPKDAEHCAVGGEHAWRGDWRLPAAQADRPAMQRLFHGRMPLETTPGR